MEEYFLNTFLDYAKQDGKKPCLAFFHQDQFYNLPRWWVRNKIKHFALGLFHHKAQRGEHFYLSSELSPQRVYTELGALLAGLKLIPLPPSLAPEKLRKLCEKYPPHYIYGSPAFFEEHHRILIQQKSIKLMISEPALRQELFSTQTFREIFNAGIIHENKHHAHYKEAKEKLKDSCIVEIDWLKENKTSYQLVEKTLNHSTFHEWLKEFQSNWKKQKKNAKQQFFWAQIDLSQNLDRAIGLYAPLATGNACLCLPIQKELPKALSWNPPHQIYLNINTWEALIKKLPPYPKNNWNPRAHLTYRWKRRQLLGKKLNNVWFPPNTSIEKLQTIGVTKIQLSTIMTF